MTVLSDGTIRELVKSGVIGIDPYEELMVQPSSVDIRAGDRFRVFHNGRHRCIDVKEDMKGLTEEVRIPEGEAFILHPGEFVLGTTLEKLTVPNHVVARLEGKSSLGRLGLVIHSTAGFIDPGFKGPITLELSNAATLPITIYPGMPIGQIAFQFMDRSVVDPYGSPTRKSKYQKQDGPAASQMHRNF